jgi:hypothetical protein
MSGSRAQEETIMPASPIVHVELSAHDPQAAAAFYRDVFQWQIQPLPMPGGEEYLSYAAEGGPGGGFTKVDGANTRAGEVVAYLNVDDIEATLGRIEAHGGRTVMPKTEIPDMGWMALFTDPTGNKVGLYTGRMGGS